MPPRETGTRPGMKPARHTEIPSVAAVVNRAVDVVDPMQEDGDVADFQLRFEDRDEPVTTLEDPALTFEEARASLDVDGVSGNLAQAAAVATYLAHRRDQLDSDAETLIELASRAGDGA